MEIKYGVFLDKVDLTEHRQGVSKYPQVIAEFMADPNPQAAIEFKNSEDARRAVCALHMSRRRGNLPIRIAIRGNTVFLVKKEA